MKGNKRYVLIPLILFFGVTITQAQIKITTYYPKYDSIGFKTPIFEQYEVSKKDSSVKNGEYMKLSPEGDTMAIYQYKKNIKHGLCKDFYETGTPKYIVTYDEGKKEGEAFYFKITGELIFKEEYRNPKHKHDLTEYFQYAPNGSIQVKAFLKENNFDSTFTEFYENGAIKSIYRFSNNLKNGPYESYTDKGIVIQRGHYRNNNLHGVISSYNTSGAIKLEGEYMNGTLNRILKEF